MKKRILLSLLSYIGILGGSITLGATVEMQLVHYVAMFLILIGGYAMAWNYNSK
jgi:hypothetical protein